MYITERGGQWLSLRKQLLQGSNQPKSTTNKKAKSEKKKVAPPAPNTKTKEDPPKTETNSTEFVKPDIYCYSCGSTIHLQSECPYRFLQDEELECHGVDATEYRTMKKNSSVVQEVNNETKNEEEEIELEVKTEATTPEPEPEPVSETASVQEAEEDTTKLQDDQERISKLFCSRWG